MSKARNRAHKLSSEHHIRRAMPEDMPAAEEIEKESFGDPWKRELMDEVMYYHARFFFVAESQNKVLGFAAGGLEHTGEELYGHIMNIAVQKEERGCGIGTSLTKRLENEFILVGVTAVQLEVRISNEKAILFYKNNGYCPVFSIAEYYADGEDALLMMKWFYE